MHNLDIVDVLDVEDVLDVLDVEYVLDVLNVVDVLVPPSSSLLVLVFSSQISSQVNIRQNATNTLELPISDCLWKFSLCR